MTARSFIMVVLCLAKWWIPWGTGDSFIAGFLYAICEGKGIQEAMADGAANSSVTIAYSGAW